MDFSTSMLELAQANVDMMSKQKAAEGDDDALAVVLLPGDAEALPFGQSGEREIQPITMRYR